METDVSEPAGRRVEPGPLLAAGFDASPLAQLIVDLDGNVAHANGRARGLFGLNGRDGRVRLAELDLPGGGAELGLCAERALGARHPVELAGAPWSGGGEAARYDVLVAPLEGANEVAIGVCLAFADVSAAEALRSGARLAEREAATAYRELRSAVTELETTTEELRVTNEELQTTNRALASVEEELRERTEDALRSGAFLASVLASLGQPVVIVDLNLRVVAWNDAAAVLWDVTEEDVDGRFFLDLDLGLPTAELAGAIAATLADEWVPGFRLDAHDGTGRPIACTVCLSQLRTHEGHVCGAILVVTAEPQVE